MIGGAILAGGRSSRMGGTNKCFEMLGDETLLARAIRKLARQVSGVIVSADPADPRFDAFDGVVRDARPDYAGPLAGIEALMRSGHDCGWTHLAIAPADTPFFPEDWVAAVADAAEADNEIVIIHDGQYPHPAFGLWPIALAAPLTAWLDDGGDLKIMAFVRSQRFRFHPFVAEPDPFFNVNTPDDLAVARARLKTQAS